MEEITMKELEEMRDEVAEAKIENMRNMIAKAKATKEEFANIGKNLYEKIGDGQFGELKITDENIFYIEEKYVDSLELHQKIKQNYRNNIDKISEGFGSNGDVVLIRIEFFKNSEYEEYFRVIFKES